VRECVPLHTDADTREIYAGVTGNPPRYRVRIKKLPKNRFAQFPSSETPDSFSVMFLYSIAALGALVTGPSTPRGGVVRAVPRRAFALMGQKIVVTDDAEKTFYNSRGLFQLLHDYGDFDEVTALSSSVSNAKKMLLSRQARYSGLVDVLKFSEGELAEAMAGADIWLAVNADEAKLASQIAAAKAAGVKRVFVHVSPDGAALGDAKAVESALAASGERGSLYRSDLRNMANCVKARTALAQDVCKRKEGITRGEVISRGACSSTTAHTSRPAASTARVYV